MADKTRDPNELTYRLSPRQRAAINDQASEGQANATPGSQVEKQLPFGVYREILFKRKQISLFPPDAGHWWVEMYSVPLIYNKSTLKESYGWYPFIDKDGDGKQDYKVDKNGDRAPVRPGLGGTLAGVPGKLNRGGKSDPHANGDAGIDWNVDDIFYVIVHDSRDVNAVKACIRNFATHHKAKWGYPGYSGVDSCQSFQEALIDHCQIYLRRTPMDFFKAQDEGYDEQKAYADDE
jgi:hypothetical protein